MSATVAKSGFGTLLASGDGASPEVFSTITEVLDLDGPELSHPTLDATNNDSPNSCEERVVRGYYTPGQVTFNCNFSPVSTTQKALYTALKAGTKSNRKITWSDSGTTAWGPFGCFVTKIKPSSAHDKVMLYAVTLELSGQPTLP